MKKEDILEKAKYILFPYMNKIYDESYLSLVNSTIIKLPIIKDDNNDIMYDKMPTNKHHYTMYYHINYVIPILNKLFNFGFNINDFNLINYDTKYGDLSYLKPKEKFHFNVICFTDNTNEILEYEDLKPINNNEISYRDLYRFPHKCSKIINLSKNNNKKIFISGDSQSIPDIPLLACYYKEVWYFDNRTGKSIDWTTIDKNKTIPFSNYYQNTIFDDVLIQLYKNPLWWYTDINLM